MRKRFKFETDSVDLAAEIVQLYKKYEGAETPSRATSDPGKLPPETHAVPEKGLNEADPFPMDELRPKVKEAVAKGLLKTADVVVYIYGKAYPAKDMHYVRVYNIIRELEKGKVREPPEPDEVLSEMLESVPPETPGTMVGTDHIPPFDIGKYQNTDKDTWEELKEKIMATLDKTGKNGMPIGELAEWMFGGNLGFSKMTNSKIFVKNALMSLKRESKVRTIGERSKTKWAISKLGKDERDQKDTVKSPDGDRPVTGKILAEKVRQAIEQGNHTMEEITGHIEGERVETSDKRYPKYCEVLRGLRDAGVVKSERDEDNMKVMLHYLMDQRSKHEESKAVEAPESPEEAPVQDDGPGEEEAQEVAAGPPQQRTSPREASIKKLPFDCRQLSEMIKHRCTEKGSGNLDHFTLTKFLNSQGVDVEKFCNDIVNDHDFHFQIERAVGFSFDPQTEEGDEMSLVITGRLNEKDKERTA